MRHTFACIDAHTCGNPVRVITSGHPKLQGADMSAKRQDFVTRFDWIRQALMFEPRGHDMMSGAFIYPPCTPAADAGILFVETSGCLPMCGHGTIGTVTVGIEHGLILPRTAGRLLLEVPAGHIEISYRQTDNRVTAVTIQNVASYLAAREIAISDPELGALTFDVAYGGNYYAIVDPQTNFPGLDQVDAAFVLHHSPRIRTLARQAVQVQHPDDATIQGISHVMWTGAARSSNATSANAVFYGERAIDRSPCGTGTSARMAQLHARGKLAVGERFVHESIIGSHFIGHIEAETQVGPHAAIRPSIQGSAHTFGFNTLFIDSEDPYPRGFTVK